MQRVPGEMIGPSEIANDQKVVRTSIPAGPEGQQRAVEMSKRRASYILGKLAHASLADVCRWIVQVRDISARLAAPEGLSCAEMILALFPDAALSDVEACRLEFLRDYTFCAALNENMIERRHRRVQWTGWHEFLYVAVRFLKPSVVFETGVFDGQSSAIILLALSKNSSGGELISVDLPARETIEGSTDGMPDTTLPPGCQPGWAIPNYLRKNHELVLGDSRALLPQLLQRHSPIDVFFHDSLHTFDHMYFEYTTAWPHLLEGGLLLSDDIFWNRAFYKFCKGKRKQFIRLEGFGAVRK